MTSAPNWVGNADIFRKSKSVFTGGGPTHGITSTIETLPANVSPVVDTRLPISPGQAVRSKWPPYEEALKMARRKGKKKKRGYDDESECFANVHISIVYW